MKYAKTAVHCFGRHLQAKAWEAHMWLDGDRLGQIPTALFAALEYDASLLTFGTGASEKEGVKEAEYERAYALEHLEDLTSTLRFGGAVAGKPEIDLMTELLVHHTIAETTSKNTVTELQAIGKIYLEKGIERVIAVTNPSHAPRCRRDIDTYWDTPEFHGLRRNTLVLSSEVPFPDATAADTVILEPPHRGDDTSPPFYKLVPRIFKIAAAKKASFYDHFDDLLKRFEV